MSTMGLNQKSITENYLENLQIIGNKITYQNNPWVKYIIKREIRKYFELNENKNTIYQIYFNKFNNFLERQELPKLTPGEINNINSSISILKLICSLISSYAKILRPRWFHWRILLNI